MVDSDMNGLLSRSEFNMYSIRTGEDEIGDEEWQVVQGVYLYLSPYSAKSITLHYQYIVCISPPSHPRQPGYI